MKKFKKFIIYLYCLPVNILLWLLVLFMWWLWGENLRWDNGIWFDLKRKSWFNRKFYSNWAGTTFGHAGFFGGTPDPETIYHERIHILQYERRNLSNLLVLFYCVIAFFIVDSIWMAAIISYLLNGLVVWVPNWIHAWLSNKPIYRGSLHEEAAYGLTKLWELENERNRIRNQSVGKSN